MAAERKASGRSGWIVARSLYVAARALRARPRPPWSDIADMERLLETKYGAYAVILRSADEIDLALRLGYPGEEIGSVSRNDLRRWIEAKQAATINVTGLSGLHRPDGESDGEGGTEE